MLVFVFLIWGRRQERYERHQVVTPAPPDQEHEHEHQQREQNDLVGRQSHVFPLLMRTSSACVLILGDTSLAFSLIATTSILTKPAIIL